MLRQRRFVGQDACLRQLPRGKRGNGGALEARFVNVHPPQMSSIKYGLSRLRLREISTVEAGALQVRLDEHRLSEIRVFQVRVDQHGIAEVGRTEVH